MSIENITKPNFKDIYCKDLDVSNQLTAANFDVNTINVTNLTIPDEGSLNFVQGSKIKGRPDFDDESITNFSTGSRIEGDLIFANDDDTTTIVTNGGTEVTINGKLFLSGAQQITIPSVTKNFIWLYSSSSGGTGTEPVLTFYKIGRMVFVTIPPFSKVLPLGNPQTVFTCGVNPPDTPLPETYEPLMDTTMSCLILNKDVDEIGILGFIAPQTFVLTPLSGGFNVDGTSGLQDAVTFSYVSKI